MNEGGKGIRRLSISVSLPGQTALASLLSQTHLAEAPLLNNVLTHLCFFVLVEGLEILKENPTQSLCTYVINQTDS